MKIISWFLSTMIGVCVGTGLVVSVQEGSLSSFVLAVAMMCSLILALLWIIINDDE